MKNRTTKQKMFLENALPSLGNFFSAQSLYDIASKEGKEIGIATIYRFLNSKVEKGDLFVYQCGNKSVFSSKRSHCHFIDEASGEIRHIDLKSLDFLKELELGDISSVDIEIKGSLK